MPPLRIVSRGGNVAIFDLNGKRAATIVAELGDAAAFFECNVMEEDSIDAAVAGAHAKFGALHGAVNCAGGSFGGGLTVNRRGETHSMETWWNTVKLNAFGTFAVCSKVAAVSSQQDDCTDDGEKGVLVNVASVAAQDGQDGQSAYSAGKGAIVAMTLPMARDLSRIGVRVCTIMPVRAITSSFSHFFGHFCLSFSFLLFLPDLIFGFKIVTGHHGNAHDGRHGEDSCRPRAHGQHAVSYAIPLPCPLKIRNLEFAPSPRDVSTESELENAAQRYGYAEEFAGLACHIIENGFLNGESIRLDGAIRMPKL